MKLQKLSTVALVSFLAALAALTGCAHHKVTNPVAQVDSKQPDKVLFDRAEVAIHHSRYDEARTLLQTLINTYPDSEFIARAKLAIADSWYDEGTSAGYQQAEREYNDFITFFPTMADAAEAQMKIANIHYMQMEKPDRDYTHAERAEEEYRKLIQQYPDSKLVPEAKQKLRNVQEVLAEREFRIGRFYYLRDSFPAAMARLRTLVDTYPLYSQADEALYMLGEANEQEANNVKAAKIPQSNEKMRAGQERLASEFEQNAIKAYDRLIERYPASHRADDAKSRLEALHAPVPVPTPEAIAQNKAEIASRGESSMRDRVIGNFRKRPDLASAAHVGDPTMEDPQEASAPAIAQHASKVLLGQDTTNTVSADIGGTAPSGPITTQPVPRSDAGSNTVTATPIDPNAAPVTGSTPPASTTEKPAAPAGFESVPEDPNATASGNTTTVPAVDTAPRSDASSAGAAQAQPQAVSANGSGGTAQATPTASSSTDASNTATSTAAGKAANTSANNGTSAASSGTTPQAPATSKDDSSSNKTKKKKHGLGKLNPF